MAQTKAARASIAMIKNGAANAAVKTDARTMLHCASTMAWC